jgi:hypothetical protein
VDIGALASGKSGVPFDADVQTQRPALAEANGQIYVAFGGSCDFNGNLYHGWVFSFATSSLTRTGTFIDTPTADNYGNYMGGIWMSGNGPAVDNRGSVFVLAGNGHFDGKTSLGDSAIALAPNLSHVLDFFTPDTVSSDNADDADFGSGGILLFPDAAKKTGEPSLAAGQGKDGVLTLLDRIDLGGYHAGRDNALAELSLGGTWASPAYFQDAATGEYLFATGGPLYEIAVARKPASMKIVGQTTDGFPMYNGNGATPTISSNGAKASTAVVWIVQWQSGQLRLLAYSVNHITTHIFAYPLGPWNFPQVNDTMIPMVANGYVYVSGLNKLFAFSLHYP